MEAASWSTVRQTMRERGGSPVEDFIEDRNVSTHNQSSLHRSMLRTVKVLVWGVTSLLITVPVLSQGPPSAEDLESGRRSYSLLCMQCHGDDGDAVSYAGVLPVAGISRRYAPEVIGQLSGTFSGRTLHGKDRERIVAYMGTLRGSKGFADPGWIITPHLLERKSPRVNEFRVIDTRGRRAWKSGHVPNAVSVEPGACMERLDETAAWLGDLGITPATVVVVYDDRGGPSAACVWWRIRRAGHPWVAVLDGGWNRWIAERRATTTAAAKIKRTTYPTAVPAESRRVAPSRIPSPGPAEWNWEATLDRGGFRSYEELSRLVERVGLRPDAAFHIPSPPEHVAHLVLVLHLLGFRTDYDTATATLSIE